MRETKSLEFGSAGVLVRIRRHLVLPPKKLGSVVPFAVVPYFYQWLDSKRNTLGQIRAHWLGSWPMHWPFSKRPSGVRFAVAEAERPTLQSAPAGVC